MALGIWSILIIVIGIQGLFLLSVLLLSKEKRNKPGNTYLVLIILMLLWFLTEFFLVRNKIDIQLNLFYGTRYGSWFLLGPLTYFYFKSITITTWRFSKKNLWHFLPFVVFVIIIPLVAYRVLNDRQVDYGMLSVFDHREKTLTAIQWTYSIVFVLQFIHLGYFLIKNLSLVKNYSKLLQIEYSSLDDKVRWLRNFNIILIIVLLCSAIFLYVLLITDIYRRHLDYIYVLPIGILFYFISFKFMHTEWKPIENGSKYLGSSLDQNKVPGYTSRLKQLMEEDEVFLEPIRLNELSKMMDIRTHHLSQIINEQYQLSFFDYVNLYRIKRAKQIISNHPELTLLQIAFDSGFNNKTSFVNAFKKFEKTTPSKYREALRTS